MTTDITVRGQARDTRDPDRAILTIIVHAEARDWAEAHISVSASMATLNSSIDALKAAHPGAIDWISTGQASQTSYTNKGLIRFTERVLVTIAFTDFPAMSEWAFASTNDSVQMRGISWELSNGVRDTVRTELGQAAIKDARERANTFATAAGLKIIGVAALADPGLLQGVTPNPNGGGQIEYSRMAPRAMAMMASADGGMVDHSIDLTPEPIETTSAVEAHFIAE